MLANSLLRIRHSRPGVTPPPPPYLPLSPPVAITPLAGKIKAGSEYVEQDLKYDAANDGRDALSKTIYSRLFDALIAKINAALVAGGAEVRPDMRIIGIVDIFGFEVFVQNSLEQLCINFANEKLQVRAPARSAG